MKKFSRFFSIIAQLNRSPVTYRVLAIEKDVHDEYVALIQVINKQQVFRMKPEAILGDDRLTDCFAPRDVRTLAYLGYLGINSPKYKILAQRLSEGDDKLLFAIQEKGKKHAIVKSAEDISKDEAFLQSLDQKDAHMVGYVTASGQATKEKNARVRLIAEAKKIKKTSNAER